jgi:hypothetical protein
MYRTSSGFHHDNMVIQTMQEHQMNSEITDAVMRRIDGHTGHTNSMATDTNIHALVNYDNHVDINFMKHARAFAHGVKKAAKNVQALNAHGFKGHQEPSHRDQHVVVNNHNGVQDHHYDHEDDHYDHSDHGYDHANDGRGSGNHQHPSSNNHSFSSRARGLAHGASGVAHGASKLFHRLTHHK